MTLSRLLSALVAIGYLGLAFALFSPPAALKILAALPFPLALIWFGDELGDYTGSWGRQTIDAPSPGWLLRLLGWIMLLAPAFLIPVTAWVAR